MSTPRRRGSAVRVGRRSRGRGNSRASCAGSVAGAVAAGALLLTAMCCGASRARALGSSSSSSSSNSNGGALPQPGGALPRKTAAENRARYDVAALKRHLQQANSSDDACVVQYATFTSCVTAYRTNASSAAGEALVGCDDCVVGYWNVSLASVPQANGEEDPTNGSSSSEFCEDLQSGTCQGWHSCRKECPRKCKTQLVKLVNCISHCELTPLQYCPERNGTNNTAPTSVPTLALSTPPPTTPTPATPATPTPTPAPVPLPQATPSQPILEVCDRQRIDLQSCWVAQQQQENGDGQQQQDAAEINQCTRCLLQHLSGYNSSTLCVQYQHGVCAALQECNCWNCGSQQLAFLECLTACTFQCPATGGGGVAVPTSSPIVLPPTLPTRFPTFSPQQTFSPIVRTDMVPTLAPATPRPSVDVSICVQETQAMNACLGHNATWGISPCEACVVNSSWPMNPQLCGDIDNATCQGWDACQEVCGDCQQAFLAYAQCETTCSFPCYDGTGNSTASVVKPRNATVCPAEYAAFDACVDPVLLGYTCEKCVTRYWPIQNSNVPFQCPDLDNATCWGLEECASACNGCDTELIQVVSCVSECNLTTSCSSSNHTGQVPSSAPPTVAPSLGLSSPEPTSASFGDCSPFDRAVVQCFVDSNRTAPPCGECVGTLSQSSEPCPTNGTDANLCDLFEQRCGDVCDPCWDQVQNAVDCYADLAGCGAVQLVCSTTNGTSSNGTAETPTASPVAEPTQVETCPDQKAAVDQCLSDQLDSAAKTSCEACVETVYGNLIKEINATNNFTAAESGACDQINAAVCRALSQSCVCGPCTPVYETYLDCRVDKQPIVQAGECTLNCNSTTFARGNSTGRSTSGADRSRLLGGGSSPSVVLTTTTLALYGLWHLL